MFQYAMGRRMAETLQTSLRLDVWGFEKYPLRKYELNNFNIVEEFASRDEVRSFSLSKPQKLLQSMKSWLGFQTSNGITRIQEPSFLFDPSVLQHQGNLYLTGYWQSEKYFKDIASILCKEFSPRKPLSARTEILRETMQRAGSVAIHIRRGDYVTNSQTNQMHGVLSLDYYREAMDYIASRHDKVMFYLFSDDVAWLRENFPESTQLHIVEPADSSRSYEDMILMSSCNHNIIANSSFSWWAAWLNGHTDKIVIAPQKWFNKADMDTSDLIPENWIRL